MCRFLSGRKKTLGGRRTGATLFLTSTMTKEGGNREKSKKIFKKTKNKNTAKKDRTLRLLMCLLYRLPSRMRLFWVPRNSSLISLYFGEWQRPFDLKIILLARGLISKAHLRPRPPGHAYAVPWELLNDAAPTTTTTMTTKNRSSAEPLSRLDNAEIKSHVSATVDNEPPLSKNIRLPCLAERASSAALSRTGHWKGAELSGGDDYSLQVWLFTGTCAKVLDILPIFLRKITKSIIRIVIKRWVYQTEVAPVISGPECWPVHLCRCKAATCSRRRHL